MEFYTNLKAFIENTGPFDKNNQKKADRATVAPINLCVARVSLHDLYANDFSQESLNDNTIKFVPVSTLELAGDKLFFVREGMGKESFVGENARFCDKGTYVCVSYGRGHQIDPTFVFKGNDVVLRWLATRYEKLLVEAF